MPPDPDFPSKHGAPGTPNIRVVLVDPSHPGNIGAVARAMLNMDLHQLVLVRPRQFPHPEATARASGAEAVLAAARVVDSVAEAVAGCGFIAATTARGRDHNFLVQDVRAAAAQLVQAAHASPAAVLFGAERTGLTNEDIEVSHVLIRIPANAAYASLNLAMAVQLVCYEIFRARQEQPPVLASAPEPVQAGTPAATPELVQADGTPLATPEQMRMLYQHLEQVFAEVGFRDRTRSGTHLMARVRRILQRAQIDQNEANILRGFLTAVQNRRRPAGSKVRPAGG